MLKFKKEFENQTLVLADGTLINKDTIATDFVQARLSSLPWFGYMLESDAAEAPVKAEEPQAETPKRRARK
jgi:hypothetical protein